MIRTLAWIAGLSVTLATAGCQKPQDENHAAKKSASAKHASAKHASAKHASAKHASAKGAPPKHPPEGEIWDGVSIIAHRGSGAGKTVPHSPPENTVKGFQYGYAHGADAAELDVVISKDGHPIVIHDETLDRTTDGNGPVGEKSLAELKLLDAGSWKGEQWQGLTLPTLSEALAAVPPGKAVFVELKQGPEAVPPVKQAVEASKLSTDQVLFISFNVDTITEIKKQMPAHEAQWLISFTPSLELGGWKQSYKQGNGDGERVEGPANVDALIARARGAGLDGVDSFFAIPPGFPRAVREAELGWTVWTVNTPDVAQHVVAKGVGAITTDDPAFLEKLFKEQGIKRRALGISSISKPTPW